MEQYTVFAKVYDQMMDNIPYEQWEEYIKVLLNKYNVAPMGRIAELGCGTGRMTRLLAADGYKMTGIDLSEHMLAIAIENGASDGENRPKNFSVDGHITYLKQDMCELKLNDKQDAIISICDSMNYLIQPKRFYQALKNAKKHLKDGAPLIFDLKTEYFYYNLLNNETYAEDLYDFSYIWENEYDRETKIHSYNLFIYTRTKEGTYERSTEVHKQRAYYPWQIRLLASKAGFKKISIYDAFTLKKPTRKSERIYVVVQ